jgi:hypothetical protein
VKGSGELLGLPAGGRSGPGSDKAFSTPQDRFEDFERKIGGKSEL